MEAIAVLRQFPFSPSLRRMSVVARLAGEEHFHVYMKGAPEVLAQFCRSETGTNGHISLSGGKVFLKFRHMKQTRLSQYMGRWLSSLWVGSGAGRFDKADTIISRQRGREKTPRCASTSKA